MNEYWIGTILVIQILLMLVGAYLYMIGGREHKWYRRFLSPVFSTASVIIGAIWFQIFNWWMLLLLPAFSLHYHLGYGTDAVPITLTRYLEISKFKLVHGLLRRGRYALIGITLPAIIMIASLGSQVAWILPIHFAFGALTVYIGIKHPIQAPAEELLRYILITLPVILYTLVVF